MLNRISTKLRFEILWKSLESQLMRLTWAGLCLIVALVFSGLRLWGLVVFFDLSALFAAVFFIGFVLILGTLPKRLRRVKEAILAKKFGKNIIGRVMNKRLKKNLRDSLEPKNSKGAYVIQFSYEFLGYHEKEMILDYGELTEKIQIGGTIPLRILTHNPDICTPRLDRWNKDLGVKQKKKGYWAPFRPIPIYSYRPSNR